MTPEPAKKRLGRGLSALLGDPQEPATAGEGAKVTSIGAADGGSRSTWRAPIEIVRPGSLQPRRRFDEAELASLVESIKAHGVLQPLVVRPDKERPGRYEIIAGERRWRAAQAAGLTEIPITVRSLDDKDALEIALIENLQREDLSAIEEAAGYRRLMNEFGRTQEALGRAIGKSRSHVANTLRLLELPDEVKGLVDEGKLTAGHARALLGAADVAGLAREVVKKGLNVRQTETLAARAKLDKRKRGPRAKDADAAALERDLSELLGLKVTIAFHGAGGVLSIHYANLEQLDDVLSRINHGGRAAKPKPAPAAQPAADPEKEFFADHDVADLIEVAPPPAKPSATKTQASKSVAKPPAGKSPPPDLPSFLRRR